MMPSLKISMLLLFLAITAGTLAALFDPTPAAMYGITLGIIAVLLLAIGIPTRFGRRPWPWGERARQMQAGSQQHRERAA